MDMEEQERYIEYFKNKITTEGEEKRETDTFNFIKEKEQTIRMLEVTFSDARYTKMELTPEKILDIIKSRL